MRGEHSLGALVLLNGNSLPKSVLDWAWPKKQTVSYPCICADGAANLLHDLYGDRIPSHIVGDLDSLRDEVRELYLKAGAIILRRPSLDENDFRKALDVALETPSVVKYDQAILVIGGMGKERIDQLFGNVNELQVCAERGGNAYWVPNESNLLAMLSPGIHELHIGRRGKCGLIPVGGKVKDISTSGLRWNLSRHVLAFGDGNIVSSSNEIMEDVVAIQTSDFVLWTMEVNIEC